MGKLTTVKILFFFIFLYGGAVNGIYGQANETVSGKVTSSDNNEALPGVNIGIMGTTSGTSTNSSGAYQLDVPALNDTLVFSYIGYQTQQVPINGRTSINVELKPKALTGQEVVVVGYGTQKRQDLTGSVSSVSSDQLEEETISTPDQALQGRVAGVDVHTNSHAPGGSISVSVRGTASLNAGGSPLYVIDGLPISTDFRTTSSGGVNGNGASSNPLNSIDPSDIASIQVLKDASATAIYGSRGANGVVLITTKSGKSGQQNVDFETTLGISQVSKKLDFMNAHQFAEEVNEGQDLQDLPPVFSTEQVSNFGAGTDWQDEIFRQAAQQKYKLTFSGGTDHLRYLVSGNMSDNEGIIRGSSFNRYGARVNIDADVSDNFTMGTNLSYSVTDNNKLRVSAKGYGNQPGIITALVEAPPTIPARDSEGNIANLGDYTFGSGRESPLVMTDNYKQYGNTDRLLGNIYGNYDLLPSLSAKVSLGADIRNFRYHQYYPIGSQAAGGAGGTANQFTEQTVNIVNSNTLTYQNTFNDIHNLKVLAGFTYQTQRDENLSGASFGFPSDFYKYNSLGIGSNPQSPGSGVNKWTLVSYLARLNYALNDKYLLTASFRRDGDSKFGANNKYGNFPSAAIAWQLGNEEFIKDLDLFSHLKLRVGWGKTGNESIGVYQSQSLIGTSFSTGNAYIYNGTLQPIAYPNGVANPDLSWEKTEEWNYGLDMGFFSDRLSISANYYNKKTTDLLLNVPIPRQTGYGGVLDNVGSMSNKGVEVQISSDNVRSSSFNWSTNFNISSNKNRITSLGSAAFIYTGWAGGGNVQPHGRQVTRLEAGHSVANFYGSVSEGVWHSQQEIDDVGTMPSAKPGDLRYKDVDGNGTYDTEDDVFLGDANPDFSFGLTNDFNYKNFNLHVFLYGKYGNKVLNLTAERFLYVGTGASAERLQRWTPDNPNSNIPSARSGKMDRVNSAIVEDGSFLRIQNVSLTYNIPVEKWQLSGALRNASLGVAVDNLAVFTNYSGYDPELNAYGSSNSTKGVDRYGYPASRTVRLNVKLGF